MRRVVVVLPLLLKQIWHIRARWDFLLSTFPSETAWSPAFLFALWSHSAFSALSAVHELSGLKAGFRRERTKSVSSYLQTVLHLSSVTNGHNALLISLHLRFAPDFLKYLHLFCSSQVNVAHNKSNMTIFTENETNTLFDFSFSVYCNYKYLHLNY